jgi:hypothetical protein
MYPAHRPTNSANATLAHAFNPIAIHACLFNARALSGDVVLRRKYAKLETRASSTGPTNGTSNDP